MLESAAQNTTPNIISGLNNTAGELRRDETVDILMDFPLYPHGVEQGDVLLFCLLWMVTGAVSGV